VDNRLTATGPSGPFSNIEHADSAVEWMNAKRKVAGARLTTRWPGLPLE